MKNFESDDKYLLFDSMEKRESVERERVKWSKQDKVLG